MASARPADDMSSPVKVVTLPVGEDEAGMRLDRWFRRRYPDLPQTHLNKIVRKGEVRVAGKRAEISTRLEVGQSVRVPPLGLAAPAVVKERPADPRDADLAIAETLVATPASYKAALLEPMEGDP